MSKKYMMMMMMMIECVHYRLNWPEKGVFKGYRRKAGTHEAETDSRLVVIVNVINRNMNRFRLVIRDKHLGIIVTDQFMPLTHFFESFL